MVTGNPITLTTAYYTATTSASSNSLTLPQGTINITTSGSFPSYLWPTSGKATIVTTTGTSTITYTGTTVVSGFTTVLTGCQGGTGNMATGNVVNFVGPIVQVPGGGSTVEIYLNSGNTSSDVAGAINDYFASTAAITAVAGGNGTGTMAVVSGQFAGGPMIAPLTALQTTVACSQVIDVEVNQLCLTQKPNVDIAIYRTTTDTPTVAYRINPAITNLLINTNSTTPISYSDYSADIDNLTLKNGINSNELLYTSGGVIANNAPPGFSTIINHQNRLFGVSAEQPNTIWYSQGFESGYEASFNASQTITINPLVGNVSGGTITQLGSMDGYLVIFQENQIWYVTGSGPGATGPTNTNTFSIPQLVASSSSIGCRDPLSVQLIPTGLMFKSSKGFYLLTRQLDLVPVGMDVKQFNGDVVSSSQSLNDNTQVIFLSTSGTPLLYDSYYKAWSSFTNHQGVASMLDSSNTYNYINNSGIICVQQPNQYLDANGEGYSMVVQTAWLKLQNIQGLQRVWRALFEGFFLGSQPYQIGVSYDYVDTVVQTVIKNANAGVAGVSTWGASTVWGQDTWGTDGTPVSYSNSIQFRLNTMQQVCQSISFTFTDLAPFSSSQTPSLNALDLVVGIKKGSNRVGVGNQIG